MILDKIVEKVIIKHIKKIRDYGVGFITNNKEEIIEMIKKQAKSYIDEHKEEVAHAAMDSLARRLDLPHGYKWY